MMLMGLLIWLMFAAVWLAAVLVASFVLWRHLARRRPGQEPGIAVCALTGALLLLVALPMLLFVLLGPPGSAMR